MSCCFSRFFIWFLVNLPTLYNSQWSHSNNQKGWKMKYSDNFLFLKNIQLYSISLLGTLLISFGEDVEVQMVNVVRWFRLDLCLKLMLKPQNVVQNVLILWNQKLLLAHFLSTLWLHHAYDSQLWWFSSESVKMIDLSTSVLVWRQD